MYESLLETVKYHENVKNYYYEEVENMYTLQRLVSFIQGHVCSLKQGFSASGMLTFWAGNYSSCGTVPCMVGCLATSLASTRCMPVARILPTPLPQLWQSKMFPFISKYPPGRVGGCKITPQLRITTVKVRRPPLGKVIVSSKLSWNKQKYA